MKIRSNQNGFTLIEILIAMVIITVASLGVVNLTVGITHGNSFSHRLTSATTLLQDRLENVKRLGYANADTLIGTENYGNIVNYVGYKRVTSVAINTPWQPVPQMKTVTVTAYWNDDKYSLELSTILAE